MAKLPRISYREAKKMERHCFILQHISWFTPQAGMTINYEEEYPDCSHILIDNREPMRHWRNIMTHAAAVIRDDEAELSFKLLEDKRRIDGEQPELEYEPINAVKDIYDKLKIK